jgi:hypothetical protein
MKRKMMVSFFVVASVAVALSLTPIHIHVLPVTSILAHDGTQPPVPPKGPGVLQFVVDGTQPPVPPKGPGTALLADGTQPPVPPKGPGAIVQTNGAMPGVIV